MKRSSLAAACFAVLAFATVTPAQQVSTSHDEPEYDLVQCLANPRPILGTAAIYRLLIANHTDSELYVSIPVIRDGVSGVTYPDYVENCPTRAYKGIQHVTRIGSGKVGVWNYPVPMAYTSRAMHLGRGTVHVEVRVAQGVVTLGDEAYPLGIATADSQPNERIMVVRRAQQDYEVNPTVYEGGRVYTFEAEYEVVEPAERDRAFYDAYVAPSLALGDCWWGGEAKRRQDNDWRAIATANEAGPELQESFEARAATAPFRRFKDNGYYAFYRSLSGLASDRDNLVESVTVVAPPADVPPRDTYDRKFFLRQVAEADEARHFLELTPLAWDWYLSVIPAAYSGTTEHQRGIEILREIAAATPDCVTKYLANELLRRYEIQHAAQETSGGDTK